MSVNANSMENVRLPSDYKLNPMVIMQSLDPVQRVSDTDYNAYGALIQHRHMDDSSIDVSRSREYHSVSINKNSDSTRHNGTDRTEASPDTSIPYGSSIPSGYGAMPETDGQGRTSKQRFLHKLAMKRNKTPTASQFINIVSQIGVS